MGGELSFLKKYDNALHPQRPSKAFSKRKEDNNCKGTKIVEISMMFRLTI
jgi:hypothetical protein